MLFVAGRLERDKRSPRVEKVPSDGRCVYSGSVVSLGCFSSSRDSC